MKQTAVEFLIEEFASSFDIIKRNLPFMQDVVEKAKEMEKQQIEDAYEIGFADAWDDARYDDTPKHAGSEQYYNETFKK